jgi:hypothetical protein
LEIFFFSKGWFQIRFSFSIPPERNIAEHLKDSVAVESAAVVTVS